MTGHRDDFTFTITIPANVLQSLMDWFIAVFIVNSDKLISHDNTLNSSIQNLKLT